MSVVRLAPSFRCAKLQPALKPHLQHGRRQVAAGYVLYEPSTVLVLTLGRGVDMFVLEPNVGNFVRVAPQLQMPTRGKTYSVHEANRDSFLANYRRYLAQCRQQGYDSRYAGAMVADVHRVVLQGGIFFPHPPPKHRRASCV